MPRVMEIVTPRGEDVLLFHGMSAREEMSRLFEYQLDPLSAKDDVNLDDILGKNVTIRVALRCLRRPDHPCRQGIRFRAPDGFVFTILSPVPKPTWARHAVRSPAGGRRGCLPAAGARPRPSSG